MDIRPWNNKEKKKGIINYNSIQSETIFLAFTHKKNFFSMTLLNSSFVFSLRSLFSPYKIIRVYIFFFCFYFTFFGDVLISPSQIFPPAAGLRFGRRQLGSIVTRWIARLGSNSINNCSQNCRNARPCNHRY